MFDRTVLCSEGSQLLAQIRSRSLQLSQGALEVYMLATPDIGSGDAKPSVNFASMSLEKIGDSVTISAQPSGSGEAMVWNSDGESYKAIKMDSIASFLSELHVVARGNNVEASGHLFVVAITNKPILCAVSDERVSNGDSLYMTFDVEETNGVLKAVADFDGNITQGILEQRLGKAVLTLQKNASSDAVVFSPTDDNKTFSLGLGSAADANTSSSVDISDEAHQGMLPTNAAVASYVKDTTISIYAGSVSNDNLLGDFSTNQASAENIVLGSVAAKGVVTEIPSSGSSDDNVPTSQAVDEFVGKALLRISKSASNDTSTKSFSANASSDVTIGLGLGTAADENKCTDITAISGNDSQENNLVSLSQAIQIADNAVSSSKSISPDDANPQSGDVYVGKGAMVWLAINFVGEVGISDFSTVDDQVPPTWGDATQNKQAVSYIAKLNDNAGDFYATGRKIAAGHSFRTLNAMDVSGMADPSYGFALCLCTDAPEQPSQAEPEP